MRKIYLFLLVCLMAGFVCGKTTMNDEEDKKRETLILRINAELKQATVMEYLKKCAVDIKKEGKRLPLSKYSSYTTVLDMYSRNRWFVADTGLSLKWFADVHKLMKYMYTTKDIIETAEHNHHTKTAKYQQAVKYFDVAYQRFVKLIQNPVKVSAKTQLRAKRGKILWQKSMRKKYNIKNTINLKNHKKR